MSKIIAVCVDAVVFKDNRIFDERWARKFPGAQTMPVLAAMAQKSGFPIVTGDVALSHVRSGYWDAKDIAVIQDMDCPEGLELIRLGASAKVLTALESPIFAYPFYDLLAELGPKFEHRILFKGAFDLFSAASGHNHTAHFPIFHKDRILTPALWNDRKFMVMVAGNKYWNKSSRLPLSLSPKRYFKWLRKRRSRKNSPTLKQTIKNELQSKRLEAIEYFGGLQKLDVFGFGWDKPNKMPVMWRRRLERVFSDKWPRPCENKTETISRYKFAVCFENMSYPGYVTEKIIDCLVAGLIPIYLGAPDISEFVPEEAFIDIRKFNTWQELDNYVESLTESKGMEMITSGQDFLRSSQGQKHSFEGFAQLLLDLVLRK